MPLYLIFGLASCLWVSRPSHGRATPAPAQSNLDKKGGLLTTGGRRAYPGLSETMAELRPVCHPFRTLIRGNKNGRFSCKRPCKLLQTTAIRQHVKQLHPS